MSPTTIVILLCLPSLVFCVRSYTLDIVSYSHVYQPEFFQNLTFRLYNNSGTMMFNGSAILSRELEAVKVGMQAVINEKLSGRVWTLLNFTTDGCELLGTKKKKGLNLLYPLIKNLKVFGTLIPEHCPLQKGYDYYIKDYYLDVELLPAKAFDLSANSTFIFYYANQQIYKGDFYSVVQMKNSKKKGTKKGNKKSSNT